MNTSWRIVNSRNTYQVLLHVVVVCLALQVVLLSKQNRQLKERGSAMRQEELKVGDHFSMSRLDPVHIGSSLDTTSARQLVFVMTTTCTFCKQTIPFWNEIVSRTKSQVELIAISLDSRDSTIEFAQRNGITFPLFACTNRKQFMNENKVSSVPLTILRNREGVVERLWAGKLDSEKEKEVEAIASAVSSKQNQ
jgi:peroxiredoxin